MVLTRMRSGFAVIGDTQFLPGYCLLLASPEKNHLTDLTYEERSLFLLDMSLIGEAVLAVCQPQRINYEILGNSLPMLHAHVWPRYQWEPEEQRPRTAWSYPQEHRNAEEQEYSEEKHGLLKRRLTEALLDILSQHGYTPPHSK
ncbi:DeoR family transcriptional regulator [Dictyobacter kobayashii]|uniref:DeoR family transcriptional regulator n=2 Tax=Dictyobacter kobayashii TaxID=2014872 RepID=A0A402AQR9_9CHLR|nr:DeoR family transcriptional regulator [Dictyobacter kobayashii]